MNTKDLQERITKLEKEIVAAIELCERCRCSDEFGDSRTEVMDCFHEISHLTQLVKCAALLIIQAQPKGKENA